MYIYSRLVKRI